jgi:ribose transport system ATP-binding protein
MTDPPIISVRGVSKTFVARRVLKDFSLDLMPGEVRGLLGQNGSGKSTLIKILAGYQAADAGAEIEVRGERVDLPFHPSDPQRLGMAFVHQHLGLVPSESVLENFLLGDFHTRAAWRIPWRSERTRVRAALADFGLDIPLDLTVGVLPEVEQAMLAIVRALEHLRGRESGLLVLDESTAYLPRDGLDRLFGVIRDIADRGFGVLFVTHRLEEVFAIASRVSVLRDGVLVADEATDRFDEPGLIEKILGFSLEQLYPDPVANTRREPRLSADGLCGKVARDVSVAVGKGEIVGLTGLLGMGWEEVPYLLFGAVPEAEGTVTLEDQTFPLSGLRPSDAVSRGLALLPADRQRASGVGEATVLENLTLPTLGEFFSGGFIHRRREARTAGEMLREFEVSPPESGRKLATLSGGNQQKVLFAKWFRSKPQVFLLHEPTHGIDVGAKKQIFSRIRSAADEGAGVLVASSEYEDLAHICDRVLVFRDGCVASELIGSDLTQERIVEQSFREGGRPMPVASPLPGTAG